MAIFKCKMCGGSLEVAENATVCECEYCGTKQTLPKMDNAQTLNMLGRANHFRQQCEFDKALEIYERALSTNDSDPELYWSLVLCRYGIEYVDDPLTNKKIPTCHRTQFKSILEDADYLSALENADSFQAELYKKEAEYIDSVQKGILEISNKEEPFDIFICYKESDENGNRTQDSVLAQDLYYQLTQEGFKVFFSRITLEDKLGSAYEPYIFAALNSSKVMVVVGTKPEYFNAVWVKNEWSRYLQIMQNDHNKTIIPAYKNMDPYDLPDALSMFQAQDMSKLGFMQDLLRGIKKIASTNSTKTESAGEEVVQTENSKISPLLKRIKLFLEDSDWNSAIEYCNKVLDVAPECSQAYYYMLMAKLKIHTNEEFEKSLFRDGISGDDYYKKAVRFADDAEKKRLNNLNIQTIYNFAEDVFNKAITDEELREIKKIYTSISEFKDSSEKAERCEQEALQYLYNQAEKAMRDAEKGVDYLNAAEKFKDIIDFQDSASKSQICMEKADISFKDDKYKKAFSILQNEYLREENIRNAQEMFRELSGWKDSDELIEKCEKRILEMQKEKRKKRIIKKSIISSIFLIVLIVAIIYCVVSTKKKVETFSKFPEEDKVWVSCGEYNTFVLKSDGTVVATGVNYSGQCDVSGWKYIVAVSAGERHTVGLKANGTVVTTGNNNYGQCDVSDWKDIVAISVGTCHTVGLKSDGTVVATGSNYGNECDVSDWRDIVAVSAGGYYTVGLKSDGTVIAIGNNEYGRCDVSDWKDIVAVSAGDNHTVGLKSDGTVVATGDNEYGQCDVSDWEDIVAVSAGGYHTVGLKSDGTVVAIGGNDFGQCDVSDWKDIGLKEKIEEE